MKIELTDENMEQVNKEEPLIVNGEEWELVEKTDFEYEGNGRFKTLYYCQPSTNRIFEITLYHVMVGYEWYDFDIEYQVKEAIEVEKVVVQKEEWHVVE